MEDLQSVRIVVYSGEPDALEANCDCESERGAGRTWINLELGHELAGRCEFHQQILRAGRTGIYRISVGGYQVAIRRQREAQRPVQMRIVLVDQLSGAVVFIREERVRDSENLVVSRRGNI